MSEDFETGLRDLYAQAAAAHAGGDGFPTTAMAGRVRRNRRVRAAAVSMATVAAVVVVGLGGAAAVRNLADDASVAPAETTTPSPTDQADETPAAVLTCGTMIGDIPLLQDPPVTIEATIDPATVTAAGPLLGSVVIAAVDPPGPTIMADVVIGLRYLVVQDGEVVGIGRDNGDAPVGSLSGRDGVVREFAVYWTGCDEDGRTTAELPVGEYELYAGFEALAAGGKDTEELVADGVLLGGPWPFAIAEDAPSDDPEALQPPAVIGVDDVSAAFADGEPLADGVYFGSLQGIDAANGTVDVDLAMFYRGQAAEDYVAANVPDGESLNDYYIANDTETVTTLPVAADAPVWDWCYEPTEQSPFGYYLRTMDEWATAPVYSGQEVPPTQCSDGANLLRGDLYLLQVRDGVVVALTGQYVP